MLFLILYKAKGDIRERERLEGVTVLYVDRFVLHSVFCLDLMVSWLFPATKQGRRDRNMFPAFGQECPRASRVWPLQCLFIFLYSWPRCWNLRLGPSWPVEHLPLLVQHVMVPGIRLGTVPGTVFLSSRLFCPVCIPGNQNPWEKAWESTATQWGWRQGWRQGCQQSGAPVLHLCTAAVKEQQEKALQAEQ